LRKYKINQRTLYTKEAVTLINDAEIYFKEMDKEGFHHIPVKVPTFNAGVNIALAGNLYNCSMLDSGSPSAAITTSQKFSITSIGPEVRHACCAQLYCKEYPNVNAICRATTLADLIWRYPATLEEFITAALTTKGFHPTTSHLVVHRTKPIRPTLEDRSPKSIHCAAYRLVDARKGVGY